MEKEVKIVLATKGALVEVTPWDSLTVTHEDSYEMIDDRTPFVFRVEGKLEDGQLFYGLYGPVVSGPERYHGLICNIILRADESDWRKTTQCVANFVVGPSVVSRNHRHDFYHPEGVTMLGFPCISRFAEISVVSAESAGEVLGTDDDGFDNNISNRR